MTANSTKVAEIEAMYADVDDAQGRIGIAHNTPRMAWAVRTAEKQEVGIQRNYHCSG